MRTIPVEKRREVGQSEEITMKNRKVIKPRSSRTLTTDEIENSELETRNVLKEVLENVAMKDIIE